MSETPPSNREHQVRQASPRLWAPEATDATDAPVPADEVPLPPQTEPPSGRPRRRHKTILTIETEPVPAPAEEAPAPRVRYSPTIKDLPAGERPRERLIAQGAQALSTAELIALLIRVGSHERSAVSLGEHLLAHFGSIKGVACASVEELALIKGIGVAKAAEIKAAIEFGNRLALFTDEVRPSIGGPRDVANLLMSDLRYLKKEVLKSILLDTKNRVLAIKTISIGDLSSSIVHPEKYSKKRLPPVPPP